MFVVVDVAVAIVIIVVVIVSDDDDVGIAVIYAFARYHRYYTNVFCQLLLSFFHAHYCKYVIE